MPTARAPPTTARISAFRPGLQAPAMLPPTESVDGRLVKTCFDADISERISNGNVRFYIIVRASRGKPSQVGFQTFDGRRNFPSDTIHRSFSRIGRQIARRTGAFAWKSWKG
jgi:hypothetical protein